MQEPNQGPDLARFRAFVELAPWQVAVTMPEIPHSYTVRKKYVAAGGTNAEFTAIVQMIYDSGWRGRWGGKIGRYLTVESSYGEHIHWCMGWPAVETLILNRADVNGDPRSLAQPVGDPKACEAVTKAGRPCKNLTEHPYRYCHAHAHLGPPMTELQQLELFGEFDYPNPEGV